jgi:tetratricopeptide (TPR) repeat protein
MKSRIRNINSKLIRNSFEDDLPAGREDSALFETIGDYMKGRLDLEDVKNDTAFSDIREEVKVMISDYNKNLPGNKENEKFVREILSQTVSEENIADEIKLIKKEIKNNKLNDITAEWVREWHLKKQKAGVKDPKTEEMRDFIANALDSSISEPVKSIDNIEIKNSGRNLFIRYVTLSVAALIGAFILIRTLLPSSDPDKLFNTYYKPFDAVSPVTRSMNVSATDKYSSAIENYKTGNYQKAAVIFSSAFRDDPSVNSTKFYLGLSQLALKNYDQSIDLLTKVTNDSGEFGKEARWYLGLSYLKTANKQKAVECFEYLARYDGFYRDRSAGILRHLK